MRAGPSLEEATADQLLEEAVVFERNRRLARRIVDAEERPEVEWPTARRLDEWLEEPDDGDEWRIEGWLRSGGLMMLVAQAKVGKTTLVLKNLVRSLADGTPFLDRFPVAPVTQQGTVVVLDFEMSPRLLKQWLRGAGISNQRKVVVLPMRGQAAAFDLRDEAVRERWATLLAEHRAEVVVWDCLNPVVTGLGLDENREAGMLLNHFTAMLRTVGPEVEGLVVHHMGHSNERARGDSSMIGWGEGWWKLVLNEAGDHHGARFISAYGRDIDQPEAALELDDAGRLHITGGSRKTAKMTRASQVVVDALSEALAAGAKLNRSTIEALYADHDGLARGDVRAALDQLIALGQVTVEEGPKNAKLHVIKEVFASSPVSASSSPADTASSSPPLYSGELANRPGGVKIQSANGEQDDVSDAASDVGVPAGGDDHAA